MQASGEFPNELVVLHLQEPGEAGVQPSGGAPPQHTRDRLSEPVNGKTWETFGKY